MNSIPKVLRLFLYKISTISYIFFPDKVAKNKIGGNRNEYIKSIKPKDKYFVVSDTHVPEIDKENKFINTGCIIGKLVSYLVIDDNGQPNLVRQKNL